MIPPLASNLGFAFCFAFWFITKINQISCAFPRYDIKEMLGAGSFGLVYKAVEMSTGREYAIKTVPKKPKKGKATPRYLLKLQTEVEAMDQLGASLNAVFLKVCATRSWKRCAVDPSLVHCVSSHVYVSCLYNFIMCRWSSGGTHS